MTIREELAMLPEIEQMLLKQIKHRDSVDRAFGNENKLQGHMSLIFQ